jgi:hypothetical protein
MKRENINFVQIGTLLILVLALGYLGWIGYGALPEPAPTPEPALIFDGTAALLLAETQCALGPRPTGSLAGWETAPPRPFPCTNSTHSALKVSEG